MQANVMVAVPDYDGRICSATMRAILQKGERNIGKFFMAGGTGSLLALNANTHWVRALINYEEGVADHFCMMHADIAPQDNWLSFMLDEMQRVGADILSAVVAIKNDDNATSTAISKPNDPWNVERLSFDDIQKLPQTFSVADVIKAGIVSETPEDPRKLLVNTGLMLVKLGNWALEHDEQGNLRHFFTIRDRVTRMSPREYEVGCASEDWNFAREAGAAGLKVFATQRVRVVHVGVAGFVNRARGSDMEGG